MDRHVVRNSLKLYLVADLAIRPHDLMDVVQSCIVEGLTCVQLRAKHASADRVFEVASRLQRICSAHQVPFIVNDFLQIAVDVGAAGVHLGVDDADTALARRTGGLGFIVGYSPETDDQIGAAESRGVSYLGIGPLFSTATKHDAGTALGAVELQRRRSLTTLPVVAVGGIGPANVDVALSAGVDGVAVASSILNAPDPAGAARNLRHAIEVASPSEDLSN
ncbi:MAG TPA: thiamine phosphate synthase [Thermomicrobiales bacterium]|nr:thiamine phosphate synthase [Thermomicrobiales bacterium]